MGQGARTRGSSSSSRGGGQGCQGKPEEGSSSFLPQHLLSTGHILPFPRGRLCEYSRSAVALVDLCREKSMEQQALPHQRRPGPTAWTPSPSRPCHQWSRHWPRSWWTLAKKSTHGHWCPPLAGNRQPDTRQGTNHAVLALCSAMEDALEPHGLCALRLRVTWSMKRTDSVVSGWLCLPCLPLACCAACKHCHGRQDDRGGREHGEIRE